MDIKMRRDASRGRKSKAGGGKKSKATQEYTPLDFPLTRPEAVKLILNVLKLSVMHSF